MQNSFDNTEMDTTAYQSNLIKTIYSKGSLNQIQEQLPRSRFLTDHSFSKNDDYKASPSNLRVNKQSESPTPNRNLSNESRESKEFGVLEKKKKTLEPRAQTQLDVLHEEANPGRMQIKMRHGSMESPTVLPHVSSMAKPTVKNLKEKQMKIESNPITLLVDEEF